MPITQERMMTVLNEGERASNALYDLIDTLSDIIAHNSATGALAAITLLLDSFPIPAMAATRAERAHFRRARERNEKNARRMQKRRAER